MFYKILSSIMVFTIGVFFTPVDVGEEKVSEPTLPVPYIETKSEVNEFQELISNPATGTIVSLDLEWEPGDEVGVIAEPPPPEPEPVYEESYSNDYYGDDYTKSSTSSESTSNGGGVPAPAKPQGPYIKEHFYVGYNCDKNCVVGSWDPMVSHVSVWMDYGPYFNVIAGHNYMGMGNQVLGLRTGDLVQIHGSTMDGVWRVIGDSWTAKYGLFADMVPKLSYYGLQTCSWNEQTMRFVWLERV